MAGTKPSFVLFCLKGCLIFLLTAPLAACSSIIVVSSFKPEPLNQFPVSTIFIESHGRYFPFKVWIADTIQRRSQGLMFVPLLDRDSGMFFIFDEPTRAAMWMKNMLIPLDLLFITADGRIASIFHDAKPGTFESIQPDEPVTGVIELPGGTSERLRVDPGAHIIHANSAGTAPRFNASSAPVPAVHIARN